ncbi:hypothetical protein QJS10_CPB20g01563 [Acorus calamus]|uniref:VTT domain-containing protein n=1 Tax=Acorus calamus TaxID=4465 RepID=A0AAV9CFK6_ACOCL|nr:hypothetical protein QJS10_CPB20g01563 [Acorus calamus]
MTCQIHVVHDIAVVGAAADAKLIMDDVGYGDYVRMGLSEGAEPTVTEYWSVEKGRRFCWWSKAVLLCLGLVVAGAAFVVWGGPLLIDKVVAPILEWEMTTFSTPVLGFILFASIAVFPALLLPSAPCMWIAGMTFGYGYGFLLIMAGMSLGMSLPYFIGSLFRHKIHRWLERWPKKAAIVRLAGEGNWFHQFRAVVLLRISPFPYLIFNYASVATNVKYSPYILGSLVGTIPETFLTIYSGILLRNLADASHGRGFLSVPQIIYDVLGFCTTLAATIAITAYARQALQKLHAEEQPLLE